MTNHIWSNPFLLAMVLTISSCREHSVNPVVPPNTRDFVWSMDTLDMPMNALYSIWGSSPFDVWTTGPGGTPQDELCHYDGSNWIPWIKFHPQIFQVAGSGLYGFAADDVWLGGQAVNEPGAGICHWDGSKWGNYCNYQPDPQTYGFAMIQDVWGFNTNDIYACGTLLYSSKLVPSTTSGRGFLLHYNGSNWKEIVKGDSGRAYGFIRVRGLNGNLYVLEDRWTDAGDSAICYQLKGSSFEKIYPNSPGQHLWANFGRIAGQLYFWIGSQVFTYSDGSFTYQFSVQNPSFNQYISGRSPTDVFLYMRDGLAHFDSSDTRYLFTWPLGNGTQIIGDPACFDDEIFFCVLDGNRRNLILHGKYKR